MVDLTFPPLLDYRVGRFQYLLRIRASPADLGLKRDAQVPCTHGILVHSTIRLGQQRGEEQGPLDQSLVGLCRRCKLIRQSGPPPLTGIGAEVWIPGTWQLTYPAGQNGWLRAATPDLWFDTT